MQFERTRDDYIPVGHYIDPAFTKLENTRMWPRIWQIAGRVEHLAKVGDYFVYDIVDQSIIVVRTAADAIKAYYNVCKHRGRQLAAGRGNARSFRCNYHGWTWGIDGQIQKAVDRENWDNCPAMADPDLAMDEIRVDSWGGFIFVNFDPNCEPLLDFLGDVPMCTDWFRWQDLRHVWHRTFPLKCNWKTAVEAFMEAYHVSTTHSQFAKYQDTRGHSRVWGNHGQTGFWGNSLRGIPSPESGQQAKADPRPVILEALEAVQVQVDNFPMRDVHAARRILDETAENAPLPEVFQAMEGFIREAAEAEGVTWPEFTAEEVDRFGEFWNITPNVSLVPGTKSGIVMMRARPNGDDPDSCIFDVAAMHRYGPDKAPPYELTELDDWREMAREMPLILAQDFAQVEIVHRGMKSANLKYCRMNPEQEQQITNMHKVIEKYVFD